MKKQVFALVAAMFGCVLVPANAQTANDNGKITVRPTQRVRAQKSVNQSVQLQGHAEGPQLYASVIQSNHWPTQIVDTPYGPQQQTTPQYGLYAVPVDGSFGEKLGMVSPVNNYFNATYGGYYANDKFATFIPQVGYGDLMGFAYSEFDGKNGWSQSVNEDWVQTRASEMNELLKMGSTDLAYDETTGLVYGSFFENIINQSPFMWASYDPETKTVTKIANIDLPLMAVGVNSRGEAYGVDYNSNFVKVDKATGELTVIGNTGINTKYFQSGCFDPHTDRFYWVPNYYGDDEDFSTVSSLCEINIHDGKATKIAQMPGNEEVGSLFAPYHAAVPTAPSYATDLKVTFEKGSNAGTVSFVAPNTLYNGFPLEGNLYYRVMVDYQEVKTGAVEAGATESVTLELEPGMYHNVSIYTSNNVGESPITTQYLWIGNDGPAAVGNLTQVVEGNKVKVSWENPTVGEHGGYFDPETLTYDIVRQPDGKVLYTDTKITNFEDVIESNELKYYTYHITPKGSGVTGVEAMTEGVRMGESVALPYECRFTYNDFALLDVHDLNYDGNTFNLEDGTATYTYGNLDANDWIVTPPIKLEAGKVYRFNFVLQNPDFEFHTEITSVAISRQNDPTKFTSDELVLDEAGIPCASEPFEYYFTPETSGDYYFGFACQTTSNDCYKFRVAEINVAEGPTEGCPEKVEKFVAKPVGFDNKAELTISGIEAGVNRLDVYRDNKLVGQINNPTDPQVWVDEDAGHDNYIFYKVVPVNATGEGYSNMAYTYLGRDWPEAPENIRGEYIPGEGYKVIWDHCSVGQHGGNVDTDEVVYDVYRYDNYATGFDKDDYDVWEQDIEGTSVLMPLQYPEGPTFYTFKVMSWSYNFGRGQSADSEYVILINNPSNYQAPLQDGYEDGRTHIPASSFFWKMNKYYGMQDYGFRFQNSYMNVDTPAATPAYATAFFTGAISVKDCTKPYLSFYCQHTGEAGDELEVRVQRNAGVPTTVHTVDLSDGMAGQWKRIDVELTQFNDADFINLYFMANLKSDSYTGFDNLVVSRDATGLDQVEISAQPVLTDGKVFDLSGKQVKSNTMLNSGTYIISNQGKSMKVLKK